MSDPRPEVAFVVREDFQGQGVASSMLEKLQAIAEGNGFTGFEANVLGDNAAMLRVFQKRYPWARTAVASAGSILIEMDFHPAGAQRR